jgi:hypothetical protein
MQPNQRRTGKIINVSDNKASCKNAEYGIFVPTPPIGSDGTFLGSALVSAPAQKADRLARCP